MAVDAWVRGREQGLLRSVAGLRQQFRNDMRLYEIICFPSLKLTAASIAETAYEIPVAFRWRACARSSCQDQSQ